MKIVQLPTAQKIVQFVDHKWHTEGTTTTSTINNIESAAKQTEYPDTKNAAR
jgi:hypothetical protein